MAPKGNPNQILLPNLHGYVEKYGKIHSNQKCIYFRMLLEGGANARSCAKKKIEDRIQGLASLEAPVKEVQNIRNWV